MNKLDTDIRELVKDKPYFMCRRCGQELFGIGGAQSNPYTGKEDKINDEYLIEKITDLVKVEVAKAKEEGYEAGYMSGYKTALKTAEVESNDN